MSDIDKQHRRNPRPLRRFAVQDTELPADRKQQQGQNRAAEKDREIDVAGKQPVGSEPPRRGDAE